VVFIVQLRNMLPSEERGFHSVILSPGCKFRVTPWTLADFELPYISAALVRILSSFFRCPVKLPPFSCACTLEILPGDLEGHFFFFFVS